MPLALGALLGRYEVLALEGAGGMGEVYRAFDSHVCREVALKVLPERLANDAHALARLKREAHVLASLNHPNISALYGVEEIGGVHALVLELVDGPTLADRLSAGAMPFEQVRSAARQIAAALEAAHDRDIVHRDLKPSNIKVRADGTVKLLDFGLAKSLEPPLAGADLSADTASLAASSATGVGVVGTAAYMSPEQVRGEAVDTRADIWAFGCVVCTRC